MKSVIMLWLFIVIIFVVLGLGFAYVIQQQQASTAGFKAVEQKVGNYDTAIQKLESQLKTDSESIKSIQGTLASGDADKKGLSEKVDSLVKQIEDVKAQLADVVKAKEVPAAPAPAEVVPPPAPVVAAPVDNAAPAAPPAVELGTIPVEKAGQ